MKFRSRQQGYALLIFIALLATASAALAVKVLNNNGNNNQIARDKITAAALTQARDALIGRAASDSNLPGSLPCPDLITNTTTPILNTPNDGVADAISGSDCPSYIGYLPWKTLGLPDLRDGTGERLWYVLSKNFRDSNINSINSDTIGTLNITGTQTANNLIAIVFSPGNTLLGQSRSATQTANCTTTGSLVAASLCATNYLEGSNANLSTSNTPNLNYQAAAANSAFNDQLIFITSDQLFSVIEKRIVREAKACLDNYSTNSAQKYPWPVPVSDVTTYLSRNGILFGRLPVDPTFVTFTTESNANNLISDLSALQTALNNYTITQTNYINSNTASNLAALNAARTTLNSAGNTLSHFHNQGPSAVSNTSVNNANNAGNKAQDLAQTPPDATISTVQTAINTTRSSLVIDGLLDITIPPPWLSSCTLFTSNYWQDWQNMLFYQVANGYQPGSAANCIGCLSITGSGNSATGSGTYRAAVLIARRSILGQVRNPSDSTTYLENLNQHQTTLTTSFETYKSSDSNYTNVNDLVQCLDGKNNCK